MENIKIDENGIPYVLDAEGNKRPPKQLPATYAKESIVGDASSWKVFDESQGHCCFCGHLGCCSPLGFRKCVR